MSIFKRYMIGFVVAMLAFTGANLGLSAADAPSGTMDEAMVIMESVQTSLLTTELLKNQLTKHDLTTDLMRQIVKQTAYYLDPEKLFLTREDLAAIDGIGEAAMARAAGQCLVGDFSQFKSIMDNFVTNRIASRKKAFDNLEKRADEIRAATVDPQKWDDWPFKDELDKRLIAVASMIYNNDKKYLSDADAMSMAILTLRRIMSRDGHRCQNPDSHLYMFLQSLAAALDPHSNYMEAKHNMYAKLDKGFVGIGVQIKPSPHGAYVESVIPTGAAEASGLVGHGDQIIAVDDQSTEGMDLDDIIEMISGDEGTEVGITLLKADSKTEKIKLKRVQMTNGVTQMKAKRVKVAAGDVIIVTVSSFYMGVSADLASKISELNKDKKVVGMVLDLRDDGGGLLWEAIKMISIFVEDGNVVGQRNGKGVVDWSKAPKGAPHYDGPLVVLVNQRSASASELTASALQDYGRAIVVGHTQSYGKGTVQHVINLDKIGLSGIFAITAEQFFSPGGKSVQRDGVSPDIVIPGPKLVEDELERHNANAIPSSTIPSTIEDNAVAKRWRAIKAKVLAAVAKKSQARVEANKAFKTAYDGDAAPGEDYQGEESLEIVGDIYTEMNK